MQNSNAFDSSVISIENYTLAGILKNSLFREKVLFHLKEEYFEEQRAQKLFKAIQSVIEKNAGGLASSVLLLEIKNKYKKNQEELYQYLKDIFSTEFEDNNVNYFIQETERWVQRRAIEIATIKNAEDIANGKYSPDIIVERTKEALSVSFDADLGMSYVDDVQERFAVFERPECRLSSGYKNIDKIINKGFPDYDPLTVFMAPSNLGKTQVLANLASKFIKQGKSGVYLTLELSKEGIGKRLDAINAQVPIDDIVSWKINVQNYLKKFKGGTLYVKEFLPSYATPNMFNSYLKELALLKNITPQFIIVDYINLVKPGIGSKDVGLYERGKYIAEGLRELGKEYKCPILTASQVNRSGYGGQNPQLESIADSMAIVNTADCMVSMSCINESEVENNETENRIIKLKFVKSRFGRKGLSCYVEEDSKTLDWREYYIEDGGTEEASQGEVNNNNSYDEEAEIINTFNNFTGFK